MEAERRSVLGLGERVLELVAVVERVVGRQDRLERRLGDAADAAQSIGDLGRLRLDLRLVREVLEAAAPAGRIVGARRIDALGPRLQHLGRERLGVAALHLRHARAHGVARQAAPHEDDEAVQPRDAVPAVRERVDRELELLVPRDGCGHVGPGYSGYAARLASGAAGSRTGWFERNTSSGSTDAFTACRRR